MTNTQSMKLYRYTEECKKRWDLDLGWELQENKHTTHTDYIIVQITYKQKAPLYKISTWNYKS